MAMKLIALAFATVVVASPLASRAQGVQVRDGNGALVGAHLGRGGDSIPHGVSASFPSYVVLSVTGYQAVVTIQQGRIGWAATVPPGVLPGTESALGLDRPPFFESSDCTGQAYAQVASDRFAGGFVWEFSISGPASRLYYVPRAATPSLRTLQSNLVAGPSGITCETFPPGSRFTMPAFLNDPSVTGFPNEPFVPPLSLGYSDVIWLLFRDGFESAALASLGAGASRVG
jgi:hypothetical protein